MEIASSRDEKLDVEVRPNFEGRKNGPWVPTRHLAVQTDHRHDSPTARGVDVIGFCVHDENPAAAAAAAAATGVG